MTGCACGGSSGCQGACGSSSSRPGFVGTYSRPRFFAGQLLTEEDLQGLSDYVAAKNRLHNRYLFGDGVACGLEVRCDSGGEVIVGSGYALDCCGNDIVVPCDTAVDINDLIARMPHEGVCDDPCPAPEEQEQKGSLPQSVSASWGHRLSGRRYQLVVEYAEVEVEPLMPYSTGEAWASTQCEASRVREGYRFAVRCDGPVPGRPTIWDRFQDCVGDLSEVRKQLTQLSLAARVAERLHVGEPCDTAGDPGEVSGEIFEAHLRGLAGVTTADDYRTWLDQLIDLAAAWVSAAVDPLRFDQAVSARDAFVRVVVAITESANDSKNKWLDDLSRAVVDALHEQATSQRYAALVSAEQGGSPLSPTPDDELLRQCQPANDGLRRAVAAWLDGALEWLLCRAERVAATSCELLSALKRIEIDGTSGQSLASAAAYLHYVARRLVVECVCSTFNPPCPTCDDPAVLLATVTVRDCRVLEICNAVRRSLLTAPNVEYWLPPIGMLRTLLERLCCDAMLVRRPDRPCVQDPCQSDIFETLGETDALSGIGIETGAIERSLRHLVGDAWQRLDRDQWRKVFEGSTRAATAVRAADVTAKQARPRPTKAAKAGRVAMGNAPATSSSSPRDGAGQGS